MINAIHQSPEQPWTLEAMAGRASMLRVQFALRFRNIVGSTPFDYLAGWRPEQRNLSLDEGPPS